MTVPRWGRIVPSQGAMLMLAGHVLRPFVPPTDAVEPDRERLAAMRAGRELLRRMTGQDFGFDLARWHELLLSNPDWGYTHPYAWRAVRPTIEAALNDPDRQRLVTMLEEADGGPGGHTKEGFVQERHVTPE